MAIALSIFATNFRIKEKDPVHFKDMRLTGCQTCLLMVTELLGSKTLTVTDRNSEYGNYQT